MKRYDQYCPIACSLSVVGERWTLLVVRELLHGPKRYTDLAEGLPGIGTNILATRLKELEASGIVEKRKLPPPAASTVYELTAAGERLRPVLHELARFGLRLLGPPPLEALEPGWLLHALDLSVSSRTPAGTLVFEVGDETGSLVDGAVVAGAAADPDVVVRCDPIAFYHLVADGRREGIEIEGDEAVLDRFLEAFSPATGEPLPA